MIDPATQSTLDYISSRVGEHFLNTMYFDGSRYLIAAGGLTLFLLVFRSWAANRRIQRTRSASFADYRREFLSSMRTVFVFGVTTLATLIGREVGVINFSLDNASLLMIAWQFALIVVLHDAYFYWTHRAMHSKRLFKLTHLHHHKSRTPTPWTAYSFTSWEAALEAAFMPLFLLVTSLLGITYAGFAIFLFLWHMIIRNVMAHAGSELFPAGWVDNPLTSWIATTTHHDLHHSDRANYGFYFTWWDKLMGTEHPRYKEEFRKNAKPIIIPGTFAERTAVMVSAGFATAVTLAGPFANADLILL